MSEEDNKVLFRRLIDEFWNKKNLGISDELFAPDAMTPSVPQLPPGPEGLKAIGNIFFTGFPDFRMSIEDIVAQGDKVAARFIERGTHNGEFMGITPTGRQVTWTEIGILRIEGGKIVESWYETDMLGLMQQLGALPAPSQAL